MVAYLGSIVLANGGVLKERRRFGISAMRNLGMGKRSVEHKINEEARHLLESFDGQGEKPFDPEHGILNAVSNIICTISFGYRFEYSDPKFANLIKSVKENLATGNFAGFASIIYRFFRRSEVNKRLQRSKILSDFIQGIIKVNCASYLLPVA